MVIKMPSSDVAADMCSSESLSLTGLVCTQAQPLQPTYHHRRKTTKVSENDINFEFSYSSQSPVSVNLHKKSESTDLFELKLNQQPQVHGEGQLTMKDVLGPRYKGRKQGERRVKKMKDQNNGGFAQKLMQSITTPCRSCSAVEPSADVNTANTVQGV